MDACPDADEYLARSGAQGILSSMVLVFSLLAVSLVWSTGQRVDVWAFLFFNLWGPHTVWLDRAMLGFTQIGSSVAALAIGLILFLAGDRLVAYELILGTLTLWIVVELVKALVRRSRPIIAEALMAEAREWPREYQRKNWCRNLSIVGAYFPWNVRTSFPGKSGRNPDIWIPGSRSTGSEREMNSYDPV